MIPTSEPTSSAVRKLIEYTLITLDGVIGYPRQWSNFDEESAALALKRLDDFDAYVMGRAGYDTSSPACPRAKETRISSASRRCRSTSPLDHSPRRRRTSLS